MENTDSKKFGIKIKEIRNQKGYSFYSDYAVNIILKVN